MRTSVAEALYLILGDLDIVCLWCWLVGVGKIQARSGLWQHGGAKGIDFKNSRLSGGNTQ